VNPGVIEQQHKLKTIREGCEGSLPDFANSLLSVVNVSADSKKPTSF